MRNRVLTPLLTVFLVPSFFIVEAGGSDRFGEYLKNDFQNLGNSLNGPNIAYTAGSIYALFIRTYTDESALESVQQGYKGWRKTYLDITNEFGRTTYVVAGSAGLFGISLLTENNTFQDAAFTSLEAVALSGVIVLACKTVFGRGRP